MREIRSTSPVSTIEEYIMLASLYWQKSVFVCFLHRSTEGGAGHIRQLAACHHDSMMTESLWWQYDSMTESVTMTVWQSVPRNVVMCAAVDSWRCTGQAAPCTRRPPLTPRLTSTEATLTIDHLQSILYTCRYLHRYKPLKLSTICVPHAGFTFVEVMTLLRFPCTRPLASLDNGGQWTRGATQVGQIFYWCNRNADCII